MLRFWRRGRRPGESNTGCRASWGGGARSRLLSASAGGTGGRAGRWSQRPGPGARPVSRCSDHLPAGDSPCRRAWALGWAVAPGLRGEGLGPCWEMRPGVAGMGEGAPPGVLSRGVTVRSRLTLGPGPRLWRWTEARCALHAAPEPAVGRGGRQGKDPGLFLTPRLSSCDSHHPFPSSLSLGPLTLHGQSCCWLSQA